MNTFPLLSTKLTHPPRRPSLVSRTRLRQKLEFSLAPGNKLTILSAPAGFGKTTLVVDWLVLLSERSIPFAWLSLDESDNDLARFLRYFVAALQKIEPELGLDLLAALELPQPPPAEILLVPLINEIGAMPADFVLVLDDYHAISDLDIHQVLTYLIDHQPAQLHLVLTTRSDPLLPLARLRARGEVNEIRSADLRFSADEALDFLQRTARLTLTPEQLAALDQRTEGWVAGLQIAAIALQTFAAQADPPTIDDFLLSFGGTHQYVFDYLAQEVLNHQDPQVIDFLYQTSILDRFNASLCDVVTSSAGSEHILKQLEQANLFILPLDEHRQWYRYHRLFADFLRMGLAAKRVQELALRASSWFEQNGLLEEAVSYALTAQDWPTATRLIQSASGALIISGEMKTLLKWFEALPAAVREADFDLCVYHAWIFVLHDMRLASGLASKAEKFLTDDTPPASRGRLFGLHSYLKYAAGEADEALQLAEKALGLMDPQDTFFKLTLLALYGQILRTSGNVAEAVRIYEEAIRVAEQQAARQGPRIDVSLSMLQGNLALTYFMHGERRRALTYCQDTIHRYINPKGQTYPPALFIYMPWSSICFAGSDLAETHRLVELGLELCQKMGADPTVIGGSNLQAALHFIEGDVETALAEIRAKREDALMKQLPWIAGTAASVEAWFQLALGNLSAAVDWMESAGLPPLTKADPIRISEQMIQAYVLIHQHKFAEARTLLGVLRIPAVQCERFSHLLDIEILLALACRGLNLREESFHCLDSALCLATPEGILRPFIDYNAGGLLSGLLTELRASLPSCRADGADGFIDQILALAQSSPTTPVSRPKPALIAPPPMAQGGLVEPITPREMDVLRLMADGLSNAEIARRLYLTVNTLKAHTNSIYGKLDVHSRMQAVNRARDLGLLGILEK